MLEGRYYTVIIRDAHACNAVDYAEPRIRARRNRRAGALPRRQTPEAICVRGPVQYKFVDTVIAEIPNRYRSIGSKSLLQL